MRHENDRRPAVRTGPAAPVHGVEALADRAGRVARPRPGEVLIEVAAAGLCHSDLSTIEGVRPRKLPTVVGHEGAGIVREAGAGVHDVKVGDHVVTSFVSSCGTCRYCSDARPNLCTVSTASRAAGTLQSGARRLFCDDGFDKLACGSVVRQTLRPS